MPRLPLTFLRPCTLTSLNLGHIRLISTTRLLSASEPSTIDNKTSTRAQDSGPGWEGREGRDHAVKRPAHDIQADAAQQGMKDHQQGKEGSDAISRKDERKNQQKAKEDFPESPDTIGMNDERGSKDS